MHHDVIDSDVWLSQCQSLSVIDPESHQIMSALLSLLGAVVAATMAAQLLCYLFCCGRPAPTGKVMVEKGVQTSLFETETNDVSDCQTHDVRTFCWLHSNGDRSGSDFKWQMHPFPDLPPRKKQETRPEVDVVSPLPGLS